MGKEEIKIEMVKFFINEWNENTTLLKYMRCVMRNLPHIYKLQFLNKKTIKTLKKMNQALEIRI